MWKIKVKQSSDHSTIIRAGLAAAAREQNEYVCERYADIQQKLKSDATDPEALDALRQYLQASQARRPSLP
jgi:hypothetical protein